ncbi:hypothetical protein ABB37_03993 [Leptomonas pyrrhocoris]|uniref:Defective in cullin neddylation protein n=1 Tax=Leptomonas pyrrhocoris TaxID=157538 RepID=A0A0M9G418_LEPPY|nr:hypothetical protein ABB37_03993 [Leptomonas pyrrhocoris]XP_015660125.1 hypothetical protein ABB37_03993 [Leptomonas pyrrhocoris]KPA81685.1 hypothetical protein ABB37_03993 [Leptomonas pyrrhocoris]KPA81686.1 hypothetical protein ABB37_03993 [Leptomonas pyrrhocoris]|eukprot:XP_015660124.1 hypothetical protein ABB37_03993 [Leptomonas pyrrhocoris]
MVFLKVSQGKEVGKGEASAASIAQEAFEFIYQMSPMEGARPGERYLEFAHFEPLAAAVHLNLEDLSFYLLAFLADESPKINYKIPEKRFVALMTALAGALPRSAGVPSRENGFAPLFAAAHTAVIDLNARLRASEELRVKFYHFLYNWCLKTNKATDRVDIAKELWSFFFSASPLSFTKEEAKLKFTAYVCFPRINQWLNFITIMSEKAKNTNQNGSALDQMGVPLDTWSQLIPFAKMESYNEYDDEDSWPVAMDDFVEYVQQLKKHKEA